MLASLSRPTATRARTVAALAVLTASAWTASVAAAGTAQAAPTSGTEQITRYQVAMTLQADGRMHVQETIDYDFGGQADRHGIFRTLNTEFHYDDTRNRVYPVDDVQVSSPTGAPADTEVDEGAVTTIRIGKENETVDSDEIQTYVIDYDLRGVVNDFADHQELYWNAIGDEWDVPVDDVTVTVEGPAGVQEVACYRGAQGSTDTCDGRSRGGVATYRTTDLPPYQGMSIVASFPPGTFTDAAPILQERQTFARAFSLTPVTGIGSVALLGVLGGGAIALASRRGRDERYLGVTPGLEPGYGQEHQVQRVGMFRRDPIAVQFQPPKDMRPGQLGTLIDEKANVVDVTATIVDLAVRGYLRIEEVEKDGWFSSGDWRLVALDGPTTGDLHHYEELLYRAVFDGRREVLLSDLKTKFSADLQKVQSALYADVTRQGWFRGNPSHVRIAWGIAGVLVLAAGIALTVVLAISTRYALLGVAVAVAGLIVVIMSPRMPARTARGTAMLAQAKGFRTYLETAEANQLRFEEGEDIFSRYLPFAIVFGVAERWAKVFAQLAASGAAVAAPTWYVGSSYGHGMFNYAAFGSSMDSFATTTAGSLSAATPSSSGGSGFGGGGFSGGGGGGGGGGSW